MSHTDLTRCQCGPEHRIGGECQIHQADTIYRTQPPWIRAAAEEIAIASWKIPHQSCPITVQEAAAIITRHAKGGE